MRWVVFCFAALFTALISVSPAAAQEAASIKITLQVEASITLIDTKDIRVDIRAWPSGKTTTSVRPTESRKGYTATVTDGEKTPLPPGTYEILIPFTTLYDGTLDARRIVHVGEGGKLELVLDYSESTNRAYSNGYSFKNAAEAKAQGNTEAYKGNAEDIRQGLKQDERLVNEAAAAAEAFARDNDLRVSNLTGAQKDLKQLQKLGALGDQEKKAALERYVEQLQAVEQMRQNLDANKQHFAELEERKFSLLPSTCPEGQSGGLLAGGINSLFGTDLAGVCDDKQPQRRDTDRPARGERDKHERKD